ncbi:MAG: hypothetical protein SGJ24_18820 [Chloroflexota bacterium]|nr:hypothetical protein [Chloroflexota bacterium]
MTEKTFNADRDLREAKAMVDALVPYVYEDALYGRTGGGLFGGSAMPALTIGSLLLRLRRLRELDERLSPAQRDQLGQIAKAHDGIMSEWRQHYVEKLHREGESRLKAMRTFFDECEESPRQCANIYLPEVVRRTIVQEIVRVLKMLEEPHDELVKAMRGVDSKLRRFTEPAAFLWEPDLQMVYPQSEFWWLYAVPPRAETSKDS